MGFNRAQFNRTDFNRNGNTAILGKASGYESIDAIIGSGLNFNGNAIGYERVNTTLEGYPGLIKSAAGSELVAEMVLTGDIVAFGRANGSEIVSIETTISADIFSSISGDEMVTGSYALSANIVTDGEGAEIVEADTTLSANILSELISGYEFVDESTSLENIDIKTCYLNVTLKPGQILIVDANTYNVLLNGNNAIESHSGDWIDELNRNTVDLKIESASGAFNLSATILYTERYL